MHNKVLGELVTFRNPKGMCLDGIFYQNDENRTTIIHIHGSFGNFYHNHFLRTMAKMYGEVGINFLSFNLSAHDGLAEAVRFTKDEEKEWEYIGYSLVDFSTCIYDIEGAINFVEQFSDRIILQGHSLGCDRLLYFLTVSDFDCDFILLGPTDGYQLHTNWIAPETVEEQIARLKAQSSFTQGYDWLPFYEYGVRQPSGRLVGNITDNVTYIPITRKAFFSILEGPSFSLIRLSSPAQFWLNRRALIYMGGKDGYQTVSVETMFNYFEERIRDVTRIFIKDGDHNFSDYEHEVIEIIIKWVKK